MWSPIIGDYLGLSLSFRLKNNTKQNKQKTQSCAKTSTFLGPKESRSGSESKVSLPLASIDLRLTTHTCPMQETLPVRMSWASGGQSWEPHLARAKWSSQVPFHPVHSQCSTIWPFHYAHQTCSALVKILAQSQAGGSPFATRLAHFQHEKSTPSLR